MQHKSFELLCSTVEFDAPQDSYAPERKPTCMNIRKFTGQRPNDNAESEADLLITFDSETMDEVATLNSFSGTNRGIEVDENGMFGSDKVISN